MPDRSQRKDKFKDKMGAQGGLQPLATCCALAGKSRKPTGNRDRCRGLPFWEKQSGVNSEASEVDTVFSVFVCSSYYFSWFVETVACLMFEWFVFLSYRALVNRPNGWQIIFKCCVSCNFCNVYLCVYSDHWWNWWRWVTMIWIHYRGIVYLWGYFHQFFRFVDYLECFHERLCSTLSLQGWKFTILFSLVTPSQLRKCHSQLAEEVKGSGGHLALIL